MEVRTLLVALVVIVALSAVDCESDGFGLWKMVTKQNFSSQIRLHPHILLLVFFPWSGECRSLMEEVTHLVTGKHEDFGSLKLMYMHRNKEKMLADAIGATERITIIYYHHSVSYKYRGKLHARNILVSILPYMSVFPEQMPLTALNTREELNVFFESTDKALLLLEFCGWTPKLLVTKKKNGTKNGFDIRGDFSGMSFGVEKNRIPMCRLKEDQKLQGTESSEIKCRGIPWLVDFSSVNHSATFQDTDSRDSENIKPGVGFSCTFEEFQQFNSFFPRFMNVAREFFLPPERHRFGLVLNRSLLPSLGVGDSGSWLVMLYVNGCPSCSRIVKEDDLKSVLQIDKSNVRELLGDEQDFNLALPANMPSVLLFVDRSSESSETRRKGKEALAAFRELAVDYQIPDQIDQQNNDRSKRFSSTQAVEDHTSQFGHPRLKLFPKAQKIKLKDKVSIMIVNEGKHAILDNVGSDLQGSSLHEILTYFLQQKKEAKLSSVANEMGFQLLSNDLDINVADVMPSEATVEFKQASLVLPEDSLVSVDVEKDSASDCDEKSLPSDIQSSQDDEERTSVDKGRHLLSIKSDQLLSDHTLSISEDTKAAGKVSSLMEKLGEKQNFFQSLKGSFFFCDGNYRLLRALTGESRIPSLVIIDPILQQHYVFPEETIFTYFSLEDFLYRFLNGSLVPYQRSEPTPKSPRESTCPPFVNLDFREANSMPRVTAHTFSEQVIGVNQSDNDNVANAWNEDVLVLFTNTWCGFCQRMELVVREVYRAIKGYIGMLKTGSRSSESLFSGDSLKNSIWKLPVILLMDCTLNDCSLILKSVDQREVYPALLLFPAEGKTPVSYEGDMAVADVVNFIADHGSNSQYLTNEKGVLWTVAEKRGRSQNLFQDRASAAIQEDDPIARDKSYEVLLKNRTPKRIVEYRWIKSHTSKGFHKAAPRVVVGSVLSATEKISGQPFENSMILIVKADQNTGFQGLIYNKPIRWESLHELQEGMEVLKEISLSFGGPLIKRGMPFVALTRGVVQYEYTQVMPGICFLDQLATIREIEELKSGNKSLADYWFFLGFSSWGWDQLLDEIAEGAWNLTDNSMRNLDWPQLLTL